jgi:hypothetical protein
VPALSAISIDSESANENMLFDQIGQSPNERGNDVNQIKKKEKKKKK